MGYKDFKSNRTGNLQSLTEKIASKDNSKQSFKDKRAEAELLFWQPTVDKKSGTGLATFRFMPAPDGEASPFVEYHEHAFQGPNGWYIKRCLTDLKQSDPACDANNILWETKIEANQNIVRSRKRKLHYVANIYIVKDPGNPENDGKVFKYRFGPKIYEIVKNAIKPVYEDVERINPFDLEDEGANFNLRIKKNAQGYRDYSDSSFAKNKGPLFKLTSGKPDDKKHEEVYNQLHSLEAEIAPDKYESYENLEKWFNKVIGKTTYESQAPPVPEYSDEEDVENIEDVVEPVVVTKKMSGSKKSPAPKKSTPKYNVDVDEEDASEEDADLKRFQALADED